MTSKQVSMVHEHSIPEIEKLLMDSSDAFDGIITLETTLLSGWSNINILGHSSEIDFVLKLPWSIAPHKGNRYQHLHDVTQFFAKFGITSKPLDGFME